MTYAIYWLASIVDTSGLPQAQANESTLATAIRITLAFAASIALLMIVIGGFRYIAAHGDPNATAQARNTLLYAFVGLIVTMLAYSIIIFVVKGVG